MVCAPHRASFVGLASGAGASEKYSFSPRNAQVYSAPEMQYSSSNFGGASPYSGVTLPLPYLSSSMAKPAYSFISISNYPGNPGRSTSPFSSQSSSTANFAYPRIEGKIGEETLSSPVQISEYRPRQSSDSAINHAERLLSTSTSLTYQFKPKRSEESLLNTRRSLARDILNEIEELDRNEKRTAMKIHVGM